MASILRSKDLEQGPDCSYIPTATPPAFHKLLFDVTLLQRQLIITAFQETTVGLEEDRKVQRPPWCLAREKAGKAS